MHISLASSNPATLTQKWHSYTRRLIALCVTTIIALFSVITVSQAARLVWQPDKNVEIIVPAAPGAAFDTTVRVIQHILQEKHMLPVTSTVVNKPGGGGSIGMAYLNRHAGDGNYLTVITNGLLTHHIVGRGPAYTEFTPINILFSEYLGLAVRSDSKIHNVRDVIDQLKKDPESLSIAVATSRGGSLHLATALALQAGGVDVKRLKIVVFNANSKSVTALLGGHVDIAIATPNLLVPYMRAGKLRVIAVSAPNRLGGAFAKVPTWKEQGIDSVFASWRGIMGPKGMSPAQVAYWRDVFAKLVQTDEWKKQLKRNLWLTTYIKGPDVEKFIEARNGEDKQLLTEIGLAKK